MEKPISSKLRKAVIASFVSQGKKGFTPGKKPGEIDFTSDKGRVVTFKMTIDGEHVFCHYPSGLGYEDWRWDVEGYFRLIGYTKRTK